MLTTETPGNDKAPNASITDSEEVVRSLKASQSVVAAFSAVGIANPPGELANIIATYVKGATRSIPLRELANMTPGSGALGTSAATGVTMYLGMLNADQRLLAIQGGNPLDPAAVSLFKLKLEQEMGGLGMRRVAAEGDRYDSVRAAGSDLPEAVIAEYSRQYSGMNFDQSTINTFAAVQLGVRDFRSIERIWGRNETVKAAQTAQELHFIGKDAVQDVAGITDKERDLYRQYRDAKTPEARKQIGEQLDALPPRAGEETGDARARIHKNRDRLDELRDNAADRRARYGTDTSQAARNVSRQTSMANLSTDHRRRTELRGKYASLARKRARRRRVQLLWMATSGGTTAVPNSAPVTAKINGGEELGKEAAGGSASATAGPQRPVMQAKAQKVAAPAAT